MACSLLASWAQADTTIVIVRHGEKPTMGLGQLSCKGLNRSLALANVLQSRYGIPVVIYAPNPADKKYDKGVPYAYVRPLATIEPLAIASGLPVNLDWDMQDISHLSRALLSQTEGTQVVAWEHHYADKLARNLMATLGSDPTTVPDWNDDDFDSIYRVDIAGQMPNRHAVFTREQQGLNEVGEQCPK
ncbi:MAG: hypothetical protein WCD45_00355 [Gallionella sp.]